MTEQNLEFFANSGELPDDPETLLRLAQEMTGEPSDDVGLLADLDSTLTDAQVDRLTQPPAAKPPAEQQAPPAGQDSATPADQAQPEPKDARKGDPEVPLKALRAENHQLKSELQKLQQAVVAMQQPQGQAQQPEGEALADLEALEADFPEVASTIKALNAKIAHLEQAENARIQAAQNAELDTVEAAIAANPTLSAWRAEDPALWEMAVQQDELLKQSPAFAGKSFAERFGAAVAAVCAITGQQPIAKTPTASQNNITPAAPQPPAQRAATATAKPPVYSLTDLPGGEGPASSETARVDGMSPVELGGMFAGMSPDQIDAWLNTNL